ncbi:ATPase [Aureococcus anophagefferens]|nr:ATPase [Aureococcus anophagefferens]
MMQAEGEIDYTNMNPGIASSIKNNPRLQQKIKNMKVRQAEFEAEKKEIMRSGRVQQNCKWQWTDWDDEGKCTTKEIFVHIQLPKGTTKEQLRIKTLRQLFEVKVLAPNSNGIEKRLSARPDVAAVDAPQKIVSPVMTTPAASMMPPADYPLDEPHAEWTKHAHAQQVQALGNTDVGIHADYTSADAGEERKKALLARHKLATSTRRQQAQQRARQVQRVARVLAHGEPHGHARLHLRRRHEPRAEPAVLAVLRHDLRLAKVEDRAGRDQLRQGAGGRRRASPGLPPWRRCTDTELQKRKEAFVAKVRAQAGLPRWSRSSPRTSSPSSRRRSPSASTRSSSAATSSCPDVEGTVWHIEGQWLKMELTKDGMAGFEWPNFKTDEFRHKKVKPYEMIGGPP